MTGYFTSPFERRKSVGVDVGGVVVGGSAPIAVQSRTNRDTADIDATVRPVAGPPRGGSELVRVTVARAESAAAVPRIRQRLECPGTFVPIVGDFHSTAHKSLADHPACPE